MGISYNIGRGLSAAAPVRGRRPGRPLLARLGVLPARLRVLPGGPAGSWPRPRRGAKVLEASRIDPIGYGRERERNGPRPRTGMGLESSTDGNGNGRGNGTGPHGCNQLPSSIATMRVRRERPRAAMVRGSDEGPRREERERRQRLHRAATRDRVEVRRERGSEVAGPSATFRTIETLARSSWSRSALTAG